MQRISEFVSARTPQSLRDDAIHVWFFPLWEKTLDALVSPTLRDLLASYLDGTAAALRFERGERGKPRLAGASLLFNVSHSGGALLVAVSRNIELGVDLESCTRRTRAVPELARRWFAPGEADALSGLSQAHQQPAFLRLWTCKEAVLKCLGSGISLGLHRVEFELGTDGQVCGLRNAPEPGEPWRVLTLAPDAAHIGALAWHGKPAAVRAFMPPAIAAATQSG